MLIGQISLAQMIVPDTLSIREVVISSYRPVEQAGRNERTIDTLILKREADASLSDMLSRYANVFIKSEGRGALSSASFRGMAASHTHVEWNGLNLQTPMMGMVDFSLIPVYLMNKITVLPGAGSVTTGSGALGGTIELKSDPDVVNGIQIQLLSGIGSFSTFNDYLHFQAGNSRVQTSTRIYRNSSKNDFWFLNKDNADIDPNTGVYIYRRQQNTNAEYLLEGLMQSIRWQPVSGLQVQAHYWFQHVDRGLPRLTTYEGSDNANITRQVGDTHRAASKISWSKNKSKIIVSNNLNNERMVFSMKNPVNGNGYFNVYYSVSSVLSNDNKLEYHYDAGKNTLFKAGYEFDFNHVVSKDTVKRTGYDQYRRNNKLFLSWQQKWSSLFSMQLYLQKEWVNHESLPPVPYFGFEWILPFDHHLVLHSNVSREVHYPTLNDLYWQPGGNPDLLSEEGLVSSLGLRYATEWKRMRWSGNVTWFYNNIRNWIIWLPEPFMSPTNIKHVVSRGLEMNLKTVFPVHNFWILLRADYALNISTNLGDAAKWGATVGSQLPYTPVHSGNFLADVRWNGFFATWVYHAYSERFATTAKNLTARNRLDPYAVNDLYFGKKWSGKSNSFSVQMKIYNLFNIQYWSVLQRPMPGINYMLLLNYQF